MCCGGVQGQQELKHRHSSGEQEQEQQLVCGQCVQAALTHRSKAGMDKYWECLLWNCSWRGSSACNMQIFPTASQKNALNPHILVQIFPHSPALPCSCLINQIPRLRNRQGWNSILLPPPTWVPLQRPPRGVSQG